MEIKIKVNTIIVKDRSTGEEHTLNTVRTVKEIWTDIEELEKEALNNKMYEVSAQYR